MRSLPISAFRSVFTIFIVGLLIAACSREGISTDTAYRLTFSADTVRFDTVFTTLGSATRRLMVYNPNDRAVRTNISLAGGKNSPFRINIDGMATENVANVEIAAKDSLYIFAEVTVDPQNSDLPVVVGDSILFETNTNRQRVRLEAYGQDVFILRNETIRSTTWQGSKPYLVYGRLTVDTLETLRIGTGVHVYLHKGADIHVKGAMLAESDAIHPIVFTSDRLEKMYRDIPGQWGSITFGTASRDNLLRHVEIRNGTNGLIFGNPSYDKAPAIALDAVAIMNMSNAGLVVFSADADAVNCLVANCGSYTVGLFCGGMSHFAYCTLANNYSPYFRRQGVPALAVNHKYAGYEGKIPGNVYFGNSIIYGTLVEEVATDDATTCLFDRCLLRTAANTSTPAFSNVLVNKDPLFADPAKGNFRLAKDSPARDAGSTAIGAEVTEDLDGNSRITGTAPDMGAYEWKPE